MNDTNRTVLDSSIVEPVPPFPSVDDFVVRERRRQNLRRGVAMIGTAAAITGLVFGIQAGLRGTPTSGPSMQPGQSGTGGTSAPTPTPRTVESVGERLSEAIQDRLSTVVPGATYTSPAPRETVDTVDGYTGFTTSISVTRPQGTGVVELLVLWPVVARTPTSIDRLGACGVLAVNEPSLRPTVEWSCETRNVEDGTFLALGTRREGASLSWIGSARYSDGAVVRVRADNNPASGMDQPVLSADDIRRVLLDGSMRP